MFSHEVVTAEHHQFQFLANGIEAFAALERLIGSAQRSLSSEMYIFKADDTGMRIRAALIDARRRGVRVRLLLDAFGSGQLPR
ncbi:MAG: cardiolipin synthase ClsB, partial [Candidatus Obscuribacterales bacterium]|nr:cardiolipin synthase ClsB [Steroidobacteraceae bacterium]